MKKSLFILLAVLLPFGVVALVLWHVVKKRRDMNKRDKEAAEKYGWKYFKLSELDSRKDKSKPIPEKYMKNLDNLVKKVLDPLREKMGQPVYVNSGLRDFTPTGGSETSDHKIGCAVDIETGKGNAEDNRKMADTLLRMGLPYSQLINEFGMSWLHVALNPEDNRHRLTISTGDRSKPKYTHVQSTSKFLVGGELKG